MKKNIALFIAGILISGALRVAAQSGNPWTLKDCIDYAFQHHTDVRQALLNAEMQKEEIKRLKSEAYPVVSAGTDMSYSFDSPLAPGAFTHSWNINARSTLYQGGALRIEREIALDELRIDELSAGQVREALALNIARAYLNIVLAGENISIAREQLSVSEQLLQKTRDLVEAGVKPRNDLYQAEARVAADRENLVKAENNKRLSVLELTRILQVPSDGFSIRGVDAGFEPAPVAYSSGKVVYDFAEKTRPELQIARLNIELSKKSEKRAKAAFYPTVGAVYSLGTNYLYLTQDGLQQSDYFRQLTDNRGQSVSLSVSIPVFEGYRNKSTVQKARLRTQMAQYDLEAGKVKLRTDIEKAYLDAQTSYNSYLAAKANLKAQEEAYRAANERYELGSMTSYDFEQVRNNLTRAKSNLVTAKYTYLLHTKILDYYAGKGLQ